jgi:hypothetical protein
MYSAEVNDMNKVAAALTVEEADEDSISARCDKVMLAVIDRRENGGTRRQVRVAALNLLRMVINDLHSEQTGNV